MFGCRFHESLGISVFVSPLKPGDISGPFELKLPFNASDSWKDETPEILFWDPSIGADLTLYCGVVLLIWYFCCCRQSYMEN